MAFASTAGTIGSVIGGPVGGVIGTGVGAIGDIIMGNNAAASQKKSARKAEKKAHKYNKKQWRIDKRNLNRSYQVAKKNQEIDYRNLEADLQFQEESRQQQYDYGMGIRDYQYNQQMRAYDEAVNRASQQKTFNQLAEEVAFLDQERFNREQLISLSFDRQQTMMDYGNAVAGVALSGRKAISEADLTSRQASFEARMAKQQARTETQFGLQESRIAELEAKGSALAIGQAGRSARKVAQGIGAKAGRGRAESIEKLVQREQSILGQLMMNQESIVNNLLFAKQGVELDYKKLNEQLSLDRDQMVATRASLAEANIRARDQIRLQRQQADIDAENSIPLKPEIAPPLPEPLTLPRPEKRLIFRPEEPTEPEKKAVYIPNNQAATIAQSVGVFANVAQKSGVFDDLFNFGGGGNTPLSTPGPFAFPDASLNLGIDYSLFNNSSNPFGS